jgi:hypothetical protein
MQKLTRFLCDFFLKIHATKEGKEKEDKEKKVEGHIQVQYFVVFAIVRIYIL